MKRLLPVLLALLAVPAHAADGKIPAQFIAKIHTEALGRAPYPYEWMSAVDWFEANGCRASTLRAWGTKIYTSNEYRTRGGYDAAAELLTLYRGALNREPDAASFRKRLSDRRAGQRWSDMVESVFASPEFSFLALRICGSETSYSFGTRPVIDLPVNGTGFRGNGAQLQKLLDSTPSGSTVWLAQKAVIRLNAPLNVPPGVTVATTGNPEPFQYALMARLVRAARFKTAAVSLRSGARLRSVWVDGQRGVVGFTDDGVNVRLLGGDRTGITDSVITNAAGWSSVQAFGTTEGFPCRLNEISDNLITAYSSGHYRGQLKQNPWTDGLSISCEDASVLSNQIVDATDVAIVLFRAHPAVQKSQVRYNLILAAGNSAYGAITIDGLEGRGTRPDFSGASVTGNTFWTGPGTHFDIGISVGTRAWFGAPADTATGIFVFQNGTAGIPTRVDSGIAVSGMLDAHVEGNDLDHLVLVDVSRCPNSTGPDSPKTVRVGASVAAGHASGDLQSYTDALYDWCIGH